jgi:DNA polymerase III subunit epsilon
MLPTLDESARQLTASGEYRVLRRVPLVERWELPSPVGEVVHAVIADVETTGTGDDDEVVELGMLPIDYCKETGRIVAVHYARSLNVLRQPSFPIPVESQRIHGISDAMVAGQNIAPELVSAAVEDAAVVICHNASFDRRMLERHWPEVFEPLCFACSCNDINWRAEGFETAALKWLLVSHGYFHEGHRALDDALATAFLLTLLLPSGQSAMSALLEHAREPMTLVQAIDTNFDQRDLLKQRGYRWEPGGNGRAKAWVLATTEPEAEVAWLTASRVWQRGTSVALRAVPANLRYSTRMGGA